MALPQNSRQPLDELQDPKRNQLQHVNSGNDCDRLILQVRAFLKASEDVDIDTETLEDLIQALNQDDDPSSKSSSDEDLSAAEHLKSDAAYEELYAFYRMKDGAQDTWTKQEVRQMMYHLKEHGMSSYIKEYVSTRNIAIPKLLRAFGVTLCEELESKRPTTLLYFLKVVLSRELRLRDKLGQYNTISDAVNLIRSSRRILILTGAGISVSCGIPDFRSRDGLYASLKDHGEYDLDDPQQMFDIGYFRENPAVFYSFASQIYPSNFIPSPCHRFIKLLEDRDQLLRNYTQNIDTLETLAGVRRVLQCHGSFATASCLLCRRRVPGAEIEADIMNQKVSRCVVCNPPSAIEPPQKKKGRKKAKGQWDSEDEDESDGPLYPPGIMKPDITFFGEKLTDDFDKALAEDRDRVDLLLVVGTSLKVSPVAELLSHLPHSVPQILINKTPVTHINPDIILLGNADEIVQYLCNELRWELPPTSPVKPGTRLLGSSKANERPQPPERVGDSHVWLFDGAENGKWVQDLREELTKREEQEWIESNDTLNDRKREYLDINREEPAMKKVKSEQNLTSFT